MHFQAMDPTADEGEAHVSGQHQTFVNDALDDVFDSEPTTYTSRTRHSHHPPHPSDMHRLETEHTTAGYREGLTAAKESSVQTGFDEGYSLGATIGIAAGQLIGILEAITEALVGTERSDDPAAVLADARTDLTIARIFSPEYWTRHGIWAFPVEGEGGKDVLFTDVAGAHPLIRKWTAVVDQHVARWNIDRSVFDHENVPRLEAQAEEPVRTSSTQQTRKPLDW